jgi:citrate synthase
MNKIEDTGLRGIVVADTKISAVDGEKGELIYRGYDIGELAKYSTFEETSYLLLNGTLPTKKELDIFKEMLNVHKNLPAEIIKNLKAQKDTAHPMDVLQSMIPMLSSFDENARLETKVANIEKSIILIAKMATLVAYWDRIRKNLEIKKPKEDLGYAANFLYMLKGEIPDVETAQYLDTSLVLHAEHSFNASTFTARVVASTHAQMYACTGAALAALSGELHGGANSEVMKMLIEIGNVDSVEEWIKARLDSGMPIMGIGHAVYKTVDPRARILSDIAEKLAKRAGNTKLFELSKKIESIAMRELKKRKGIDIYPNIDFYSANVYHMLGFDTDLFTPIFAVARTPGWCAHIIEEKFAEAQPKPVLYRPDAAYIGRYCGPDKCKYISLEKR